MEMIRGARLRNCTDKLCYLAGTLCRANQKLIVAIRRLLTFRLIYRHSSFREIGIKQSGHLGQPFGILTFRTDVNDQSHRIGAGIRNRESLPRPYIASQIGPETEFPVAYRERALASQDKQHTVAARIMAWRCGTRAHFDQEL